MHNLGYYMYPSINNENVVFVGDDDLWKVNSSGGAALRLTANQGQVVNPKISPDGKLVAYVSTDSAQRDVYLISIDGGEVTRLTYCEVWSVVGWKDDDHVIFRSYHKSHHIRAACLYSVNIHTKKLTKINVGPASHISYNSAKQIVLGRNCQDSALWKRYQGGTAGTFWVGQKEGGLFKQILKKINHNLTCPQFIDNKIYFISDHEGCGNVYSCNSQGTNLKRLTHHEDYYVRNLDSDGKQLIYQSGGDLYVGDLSAKNFKSKKIEIVLNTPANQAKTRFEEAINYLEDFSVSNNKGQLALVIRGKLYQMPPWVDAPKVFKNNGEGRFKNPTWLKDGKTMLASFCNIEGEEELFYIDSEKNSITPLAQKVSWGKIWKILPNNVNDLVAIVNNKQELWVLNAKIGRANKIDTGKFERPHRLSWSPDGKYLAYDLQIDKSRTGIKIYDTKKKSLKLIFEPILFDYSPTFDPNGKYLYFISVREFPTCFETPYVEPNFTFTGRPYAFSLQKEFATPFEAHLTVDDAEGPDKGQDGKKLDSKKTKTTKKADKVPEVLIDFHEADKRILPFPSFDFGGYLSLNAIEGKVFFLKKEIKPMVEVGSWTDRCENFELYQYSFSENKKEVFHKNVSNYDLSLDSKNVLLVISNKEVRLIESKAVPKADAKGVNKKDGYIDLNRIKLRINPKEEWKQMYREAWVLQREHFWTDNMSKVDWEKVYKRYYSLLNRIKTRREFSDLLWEMQGELGTSHCYEFLGDYHKKPPVNIVGKLGAEVAFRSKAKAFEIVEIFKGDSWINMADSPLNSMGVHIQKGDLIYAVDNEEFQGENDLGRLLENKAGVKVNLTIKRQGKKKKEDVCITTLSNDNKILYRQWVEKNKKIVHKKSNGKLGYVHIPDMGFNGFSEFYRHFLAECRHEGLVIDVRYNGGGFCSQYVLKMLAQKIIGFDKTRWGGHESYPFWAVPGSMVAITNEQAGSDGDIFSHVFKLLKLGKLIGTRTWGGVIGIDGKYMLKDGTITTQPEYSFWFKDVGFDVENYGTDPDIEMVITPQDWAHDRDPQLDRAIKEALNDLKKNPPLKPNFKKMPNLKQPKLPKV